MGRHRGGVSLGKRRGTHKPGNAAASRRVGLQHIDRAILEGATSGFVKVHVAAGSDRIVGATIVAEHAGEMLGEFTLAMKTGLGLRAIGSTIHPYPTVAEAIRPVGRIQYDGILMVPLRFSAGFMLGENPFGLFGPKSEQAYGHLGFVSVLCWADPQRDISVALLNTCKSVSPTGALAMARVLGAINRSCPRD